MTYFNRPRPLAGRPRSRKPAGADVPLYCYRARPGDMHRLIEDVNRAAGEWCELDMGTAPDAPGLAGWGVLLSTAPIGEPATHLAANRSACALVRRQAEADREKRDSGFAFLTCSGGWSDISGLTHCLEALDHIRDLDELHLDVDVRPLAPSPARTGGRR